MYPDSNFSLELRWSNCQIYASFELIPDPVSLLYGPKVGYNFFYFSFLF